MTSAVDALTAHLVALLGEAAVVRDPAERALHSRDAFWQSATAALVVRPADRESLARAVALVAGSGFGVIPRGGGMSYTRGYVPDSEQSVIFDTGALNRILEINEHDRFVTAEAGVTWQQLYEALTPLGLRTPYYGPMSGQRATVGGALAQNSMFFGSAAHGTVAESVLGLTVALADGTLVTTGSGGVQNGSPFFRHYGPDLTGLFLADTGAMGVKVAATLRLMPRPVASDGVSFAFDDFASMLAAQGAIMRARLAAECFGLDPYLNGQRTMVRDLASGLKAVADVARGAMRSEGSVAKGLKAAFDVASAGPAFAAGVRYSLHVTVEGDHEADVRWRLAEARRHCAVAGREIEPVIPRVIRATPFKHPGEFLVGHAGERWVPLHACLPLSRVPAVHAATMAYFASKATTLREFHIETSHLTGSSGMDLIFEPAFYYPDALTPYHARYLTPEQARVHLRHPAVPGAEEAVRGMLGDLAQLFRGFGATHQQLGRFYPYAEGLQPATRRLVTAIKQVVDPAGRMNPGVLALVPEVGDADADALIAKQFPAQDERPASLEAVALGALRPDQRALLVIDGTVTLFLQAWACEPIEVRVLEQRLVALAQAQPWLEVPAGARVLERAVELVGTRTGRHYARADSLIAVERLDPALRAELESGRQSIGQILLSPGFESRREGLWFGRETCGDRDSLVRTYRVRAQNTPLMLITERFPFR
jgi:D-lactate dehydrogenase (cytochrome)